MLSRALERVEELVVDRPRAVLFVALAATLLAGWQGAGIDVRTSRRELVAEGDAPQRRYDEVTAELGEIQPLIVVLEAEDPTADVAAAATALAEHLRDAPAVSDVLYRLDPEWVLRAAPWLAEPHELREAVRWIEGLLGDGPEPVRLDGLADVNERIAERLESALASGDALPADGAAPAARALAELMEGQAELLERPQHGPDLRSRLLRAAASRTGLQVHAEGVYADAERAGAFLFVLGSDPDGALASEQELVRLAREGLAALESTHPGVRGGLTGRPAMTVEEMDTIAADGRLTSVVALAGVVLLASAAFHWKRHALLGLAVLGAGVIWALAGVQLQIGYLNVITTAMIPILIGIGIDYAVHPISQYELERLATDSRLEAVRRTFRTTSEAVVVSALTTAAAFACFLFMEFRGFAELGQAASVGVVLCLVAALLVLPALLAIGGRRPEPGNEPSALVDRVWTAGTIDNLCRWPRAVAALTALVTGAAVLAAGGVQLRSSLLELLPPTAESLRYLDRVDDSSFGAYFNVVLVEDLAALQAIEARAAEHPEIRRFDSIARLLPADPEAARAAAAQLRDLLDRIRIQALAPHEQERLPASLERLERALAGAADAAFVSGMGAAAGALERARSAAADAAGSVAGGLSEGQRARLARSLEQAAGIRAALLEAMDAGPPRPETLPESVRARFVTPTGRLAGYLYSDGSIFEPGFLARFNTASRTVAPGAIGWPMLFEAHSAHITDGFQLALTVGGLAVLALLWLNLRRALHVALATLPVILGLTWMLGAMRLLGLSFNFANLIAIPLVLGVGIDAGVHVMHRFRMEGAQGIRIVLEHTGRAVLIASLTTMVGFGSLMLAHHRGMAGLGTLLLLGVGGCLVAALVVLPNLLVLLRLADR